ncbi:hypothetical protein Clacol_008354 [Clathrus columnatus]|uniref:Alpha/beta hydrolase fold-3 domain-containing protein n=1 Tax=Clathrus columnatus TaxID=1419009 RepID=A0AAV5AK96_9AGAM|nr:hypothetical protein Clacol_008354 [Clathrus columnatus]
MPSQSESLTLSERFTLVLRVGAAGLHACAAGITYPFASKKLSTLGRDTSRVFIRHLVKRCNIAQLQWLLPSSTKAYLTWIKVEASKQGAPSIPVIDEVKGGAKIHWIGDKTAKKVIFFMHSGGFVLPLNNGHLNLANSFRRYIFDNSQIAVKVAFLEYTLVPHAIYPTQFRQAVEALKHILDLNISPSDIVICGDSAGGLLCFQLLSHLLHPYPSFPVISSDVPFAGILSMSPWLIFDSMAPSYVDNGFDVLIPSQLRYWADTFRNGTLIQNGSSENDGYWAEPRKAPNDWWSGSERVVNNIMLTSGAWEILHDDVQDFGKLLKEVRGDGVDVVEEADGIHIGPTMDSGAHRLPSELTGIITRWVYERLTT